MSQVELLRILDRVAREYPDELAGEQLADIPRIAFNIELALGVVGDRALGKVSICDVGGGIGLFSVGCAALGIGRAVLVDDFGDAVNRRVGDGVLDLHRRHGVEVVSRDVITHGLHGGVEGPFDAITTFDSMEHWHHSPKRLFREIVQALKPGGGLIVGVPNCVNLRRRITVPFGHGKWSGIQEWYEAETFRGHVREPDVSDLCYIARDLGLSGIRILGRNWAGHYSGNALIRCITKLVDRPLRLVPSLCSGLYLLGRKASIGQPGGAAR
jgi:2-polyprenyl-3-methyl-5-hydroxy-6-metoxy-1,4-benzoquinol methylase